MTLPSRYRILISSSGGMRLSTLSLSRVKSFTSGWGRNVFVPFKPPRQGTEPLTLAWKAAVLTTTSGPLFSRFGAGIHIISEGYYAWKKFGYSYFVLFIFMTWFAYNHTIQMLFYLYISNMEGTSQPRFMCEVPSILLIYLRNDCCLLESNVKISPTIRIQFFLIVYFNDIIYKQPYNKNVILPILHIQFWVWSSLHTTHIS